MIKLAEYGSFTPDECSRVTVLRSSFSSKVRAQVNLIAATEGWEPAGSVARWTDGYFAVRWEQLGAIHGRRYHSMLDATAHYLRLTQ